MRDRLTTLVLAAIVVGVLATDDQVRTGPILAVLAALFAATLIRPTVRLRELALAATVAVGALSSLVAGLVAASSAIAILVVAELTQSGAADRGTRLQRSMPVLVLMGCVMIAIGLGDQRIEPTVDAGPDTREPVLGNMNLDAIELAPDAIELAPDAIRSLPPIDLTYDPIRDAEISAALTELGDALIEIPATEGGWGGPWGRPFDDTAGDEAAQPLRWWMALIITAVGIAALVAGWRIRGNGSMLQLAAPVAPPEPAPLDWYDRIVEAAGHPRGTAEPVLGHSRRLADRTGDERFRQLGRIVSDHVYNAQPFTDADLDLIRQLRRTTPPEPEA